MNFRIILYIMLNLLCFSSNADLTENFTANKYKTERILSAINEINKAAVNSHDHEKTARKVAKTVLSTYMNPEEISKIGILCYYMASGSAKNASYDAFFYQALYATYMRLEELNTEEALKALYEIGNKTNLQSGEKLALNRVIERVKKRLVLGKSKRD